MPTVLGNRNAAKTHCPYGHEYTVENTWREKDGRRRCRSCLGAYRNRNRAHIRTWHSKWCKRNRPKTRKYWGEHRERTRAWLEAYKRTLSCACGENHPACLSFHHKDASLKETDVSVAVGRWSIERIKKEIAKTVIVCENCHRKHHYDEREQKKRERELEHGRHVLQADSSL